MPYTPPLYKPKGEDVVKLIWGEMAVRKLTVKDLADRTGITTSLLYRRKKHPEAFTIGEITKICRNLNIPIDDLRLAIKW